MPTPYPYPVIVLPGIMGSALRDQYPVEPETVWSPFKFFIKAYERITPHPSDTRYELKEPARVVADQVFELIYAEFIEELRHNLTAKADEPIPVFPFAYDWRQPLEITQELLAEFIDEVIGRTKLLRYYHEAGYGGPKFPAKVNLAAHSVGGLMVAGYLQKYGQAKVHRIATVGAPLRGSLEAVAKTAVGVGALGTAPGSSRERETARVTPALYYLLPSFAGAVIADPGLSDDLFLPGTWQPGVLQTLAEFIRLYGIDPANPQQQALALLTSILDSAWRHRTRVERLKLVDSKDWLCIVGVDTKTRVAMRIARDAGGNPRFGLADTDVRNEWSNPDPKLRLFTGDNTVPYSGARAKFIPTDQIVCVTPDDFSFWEFKDRILENFGLHSSLPNMNLVQRLVVSHFKERPQGEIWGHPAPELEPGQPWDPPLPGLRLK